MRTLWLTLFLVPIASGCTKRECPNNIQYSIYGNLCLYPCGKWTDGNYRCNTCRGIQYCIPPCCNTTPRKSTTTTKRPKTTTTGPTTPKITTPLTSTTTHLQTTTTASTTTTTTETITFNPESEICVDEKHNCARYGSEACKKLNKVIGKTTGENGEKCADWAGRRGLEGSNCANPNQDPRGPWCPRNPPVPREITFSALRCYKDCGNYSITTPDVCVDEEKDCARYGSEACRQSKQSVCKKGKEGVECADWSGRYGLEGRNCANPNGDKNGPWCFKNPANVASSDYFYCYDDCA